VVASLVAVAALETDAPPDGLVVSVASEAIHGVSATILGQSSSARGAGEYPGVTTTFCSLTPIAFERLTTMATVALDKENFDQTVRDNDTVMVDFWAEWCGPCRSFAPTYEAASEQHGDIVFGKVDTEDQQELAQMFGIRSIPTLMVFRDQVILYAQPGALPGNLLEDLIGQVKDLDMDEVRAQIASENDEVAESAEEAV
jgi:thioredoxin 1